MSRRGKSVDPHNGNEVWLTIDMHLQELLESVLEEKDELYQPKRIIGVIVEPKTGAILAMSSRPLLEHRDREGDLSEAHGRKRKAPASADAEVMTTASPAVAMQYEPGSVFKLVTFAGVFDRKLADMNEMINCDPDQKSIAHLALHDHINGKITVCQVLSRSSNVGTYMLARRLGEDSFMDYLGKFGFGKKTGVNLTGEIRGDVMARKNWDSLTFSRMSIGHSISVTPLQMAMATAAIANGGMLMKPQIVREVRDSKGHLVETVQPQESGRVCSPEAAAFVTKAMENVMLDEHGTGHNKVIVPGVRVAGKTGTSQRRKDHGVGYDKGHYAVSFAGFAPVENPQLAVLVVVDDPKAPADELTGGTLAGPIFAQIMGHSLEHLAMTSGAQSAKGSKE
jgi:cell division protein FtsI/penicillin-binding protein 2